MTPRWIIGVASGSSADGVDAALIELDGAGLDPRVSLIRSLQQPYTPELRDSIRRASSGSCDVREIAVLNRLLGETFAFAARAVADRASISFQDVQCIGCTGHTIWHEYEGRSPSSLGVGLAAVIAERCGVTVVSDFRSRDLAAGGQGVPLAALPDFLLFQHEREGRVLLHLGGLARVVFLPAGGRCSDVIGFEASPCNLLLDALMRHLTGGRESYDAGGKHAVQGRCLEPLLEHWLAHPSLQRRPPRSLPRHLFGSDFVAETVRHARQLNGSLHDLLCTATHRIARGIAHALKTYLPPGKRVDRIYLSGGGTRNGLLWRLLEQQIPGIPLERTDTLGVPASARKALTVAMLAGLTVDGVPGNVPTATGAAGSRLLGSLTPGSPDNWARCVAWMAAQTQPLALIGDEV